MMDIATEYEISMDMGGGGIKEAYALETVDFQRKIDISERTQVVLFTPDAGRAGKDEFFIPNLHNGLFRISAYLKARGIDNAMVCTDLDDIDSAWQQISRYQPEIMGFSPYYNTMQQDLLNIQKAIDCAPEALVVVGGFEASLNTQWKALNGLVDVIVMGEGEKPLTTIVKEVRSYLESGGPCQKKSIKRHLVKQFKDMKPSGICILGSDGIDYYAPMDRITNDFYQDINLNAFHDRLHESPVEAYWQITHKIFNGEKDCYFRFVTSDHCPWKCKFCQSSVFYSTLTGKKQTPVRYLQPEVIVKIIETVSRTYPYINHIYIDDENFLINRRRALKAAGLIAQAKQSGSIRNDIRFISRARTNNITAEVCTALKLAGWEMLSVGSESYSQDELDFMNKKNTVKANKAGVGTILSSGLNCAENYILFTPITTTDTFYETAKGICENILRKSIDCAATHFLTPLPGTQLWGDGKFDILGDNPYNAHLPKDKVLFFNRGTGFHYLGEQISVPGKSEMLPHPEIMLPHDELMREISLLTLKHLPSHIKMLKTHIRHDSVSLSRQFVTLANLLSAANQIFERTGETRWNSLSQEITTGVNDLYA